jgi:hypothetical protein
MKKILISLILTFGLAPSVLAGEIPSVGAPAPPTPILNDAMAPGDMPISGLTDQFSTEALSALLAVIGMVS